MVFVRVPPMNHFKPHWVFALVLGLAAITAPVTWGAATDGDPFAGLELVSDATAPVDAAGPLGRDANPTQGTERCTADRLHCITLANYIPDVCRTMDELATANDLDPHFLARLIWRESLFDAGAVSPAGAEGIAQFMPGTARLRGLKDPYNPAEALEASAQYLSELAMNLGNVGLAAIAYNGGEARADRFVAASGRLPGETRAYVHAITGLPAEVWRDTPPETLDVALDGETEFQTACVALAENRGLKEFRDAPAPMPWGVILTTNRDRTGVERQAERIQNRYSAVLAGEPVSYTRNRQPGLAGRFHFAQVGRETRADAEALCGRLRQAGGSCMVLRN